MDNEEHTTSIALKKVNQIQPTYGLCKMINAVGRCIAENKNTTQLSGKGWEIWTAYQKS